MRVATVLLSRPPETQIPILSLFKSSMRIASDRPLSVETWAGPYQKRRPGSSSNSHELRIASHDASGGPGYPRALQGPWPAFLRERPGPEPVLRGPLAESGTRRFLRPAFSVTCRGHRRSSFPDRNRDPGRSLYFSHSPLRGGTGIPRRAGPVIRG